jgi:hypothetical protein
MLQVRSRRSRWHATCIMRRHDAFRISNPVDQPDVSSITGPVADANQLSRLRARWKRVDRLYERGSFDPKPATSVRRPQTEITDLPVSD